MRRPVIERAKQDVPGEMVSDLMGAIRSAFYAGDGRWFKDQHFIRRQVVTWPAAWLNARGVTLTAGRYKEIVLGVLMGIKRHGQTEAVRYWPGYLKHCLQTHFKVNSEEIYEDGKAIRGKVEAAMLVACRSAARVDGERGGAVGAGAWSGSGSEDPVAVIALARKLWGGTAKRKAAVKGQLGLF